MDGKLRQYERGQNNWIDHFDFWCVSSNHFLNRIFSVWSDNTEVLVPNSINPIFTLLNLEETCRVLRVPEEILEELVTEIKRRKNRQFLHATGHVKSVEEAAGLVTFLEMTYKQLRIELRPFGHLFDNLQIVSENGLSREFPFRRAVHELNVFDAQLAGLLCDSVFAGRVAAQQHLP